jgi:chromosome segregation ATPase
MAKRDNNRPLSFRRRRAQPMTTRVKIFLFMVGVMTFGLTALGQTAERRPANSAPQAQELSSTAVAVDPVANEIGLLRKSLQTLNTRLREISEKISAPDAKPGEPSKEQSRISQSLNLLSQAELRAEGLRKQLLELIEKETSLKSRQVQIEEEMRPESIERASSLVGSTRAAELREVRRRVLDNERRGIEGLLNQFAQIRQRLEDDVKQADALVSRLRQRVLPLIEKEVEKLNPN